MSGFCIICFWHSWDWRSYLPVSDPQLKYEISLQRMSTLECTLCFSIFSCVRVDWPDRTTEWPSVQSMKMKRKKWNKLKNVTFLCNVKSVFKENNFFYLTNNNNNKTMELQDSRTCNCQKKTSKLHIIWYTYCFKSR